MLFGARQLSSSACFSIRTQAQPHLYTRAVHAKSLQLGLTLCDSLDCSPPQASLSMGFPRQEYWGGLPRHPPGMQAVSHVFCIGRWILHH